VGKIVRAVERCCGGLERVDSMRIATRTISGLYDGATTAELDRLFTESLDIASHRLDPWVTAFAYRRLAAMRQANLTGSYLGGYAWGEDVRPVARGSGTAPDGNPVEIMDLSFSVQALSAHLLASGNVPTGLNAFPDELDREIARTKLATLGIELDEESAAQRQFAADWRT